MAISKLSQVLRSQPDEAISANPLSDRLTLDNWLAREAKVTMGQDVIAGLSQQPKALPPQYFYDDRGSQLFEQITQLPEYYLTRTETQILVDSAAAIARLTGPCELVELGSGSSTKTRLLLDAYQVAGHPLRYLPIDVSGGILKDSALQLLQAYPTLQVHGFISTYETALAHLPESELPGRMVGFIGSTLGNLSPTACQQFLAKVSNALQPQEYFLLGVDLRKPRALLEAAYNDSQGITAAFNLNMLHHLNWRFDGNFDVSQFAHVAFYNEAEHQIEIYIESLVNQTVRLAALDLTVHFSQGERLLSEISRKFDIQTMTQELSQFQLSVLKAFTDEHNWFALLLCQRQAA
ncbi:MAG: L-histidine N(alpha)-methyltransferase [Leptolyngbyaceae cyanobacterium SL_1_1]|nr:L-histidine N(alpha)-methyltransferase [Leptolyngbyaceae cyanobacterium RM1_1_2]NJO11873.1 L-histidine N(alpha)-methyltransferase [Leptolyngbyaceae cyanobacterium SL_1_1]